jgi:hypothetical protein
MKMCIAGFRPDRLFLTLLVLVSSCSLVGYSSAESEEWANQSQCNVISESKIRTNVEDQQDLELDHAEKDLIREAISAVEETQNALLALEQNDKKQALAALEKVTGKLELLLARQPELGLMPISVTATTIDLIANVQSVRGAKAEAEYLLEKGYLQAARKLLDTLVSEVRITRLNLPLRTYPLAIKSAVRLIDANNLENAKAILVNALDTMVITEESISIPLLNAQFLINSASDLVATESDRDRWTDDDKDRILSMLDQARAELELAEELGYGRRAREFANLDKEIQSIEEEIQEDREPGVLFGDLIKNLQLFKERISE